ncbi:MAG: tyrosine-type recombinase/integrase [Deltaproteobacteria bacterium]|jgi:site-specific recombinase XerD|nr:tyrosine-type recombinase/integrase [Deltaproteobacteria bacterium]
MKDLIHMSDLIDETHKYLIDNYQGQNQKNFFNRYMKYFEIIRNTSVLNNIDIYDDNTRLSLINIFKNKFTYLQCRDLIAALNKLDDYYNNKIVTIRTFNLPKTILPDVYQNLITEYYNLRKLEGLSKSRLSLTEHRLSDFSKFLVDNNIKSFDSVDYDILNQYILNFQYLNIYSLKDYIVILRLFFNFLYDNKYITKDLSSSLPKLRLYKDDNLQSIYTINEINSILNSIDRANIVGQRDYAILLLASKLGLRCSEITHLQYKDINWVDNTITIHQIKTNKEFNLPLIKEIGTAIVDYTKNRPKSDLKNIFLSAINPIKQLTSGAIYSIFNKYIMLAGINVPKGKKHGPHSLRFSLASSMLESDVPIPIIKSVLNHQDDAMTKKYIKIDINNLKNCALETE